MIHWKKQIAEQLASAISDVSAEDLASWLEYPPDPDLGDIALPCFRLSKQLRKPPQTIAEELKGGLNGPHIERVEAVSGYLNIFLDKRHFAGEVIGGVLRGRDRFGSRDIGRGRTIVIDFSSPNIAKPFHVGHLRSTVIGNALYRIHRFLGHNVIGINHLGDWGTQFGKLIVAYRKWGGAEAVEQGGIDELLRLYVKFHDEAEREPALEDEARAWFARLERGDEEARKLWQWFVDISLAEFKRIYGLLGVEFDFCTGESFYNDKMDAVIGELRSKGLLVEDEGAWIVRLDDYGMPPAIMLKKDGSSLYHTRDVAAAIYRKQTYDFDKAIYVTDYAQNLHFQQWFKIIELMGYDWAGDLVHVPFGRVSLEGASLSTRKGNVVKLEELLTQAIGKIRTIMETRGFNADDKDEVARQVGVGAVMFNDLSGNRIKDVVFSWEDALNFDGETGPYVQYTHARACSVLRKAGIDADADGSAEALADFDPALVREKEAFDVLRELSRFPEAVEQAMAKLEPSIVSRWLIDLAQAFNRFYHDHAILVDDPDLRRARLALVNSVRIALRNGLALIGLASPERL